MFHHTDRDIHLSKTLSWLLRHGACKEGLVLSPEGYIEVEKVLKHPKFRGYNITHIHNIVSRDDKQRFKLRVNPVSKRLEIRANQGHSIPSVTDEAFTPITDPKYNIVVHGTYLKHWPAICRDGLSCMQRNHIHFAKGLRSEQHPVISGLRQNAEVLIYIDLEKALADGIKFYESDNGVILTSGDQTGYLKPEYFRSVDFISQGVQVDS